MTDPSSFPSAPNRTLPPPQPLSAAGPKISLFLDFDGTLVDLAGNPEGISVAPELPNLLRALFLRLEGRLAVVSGRSLANLDKWLGPIGISMAGSHGCEIRLAGATDVETLAAPIPAEAVMQLRRLAALRPGLLVEAKPFGVAMHYRALPEAEIEVLNLVARLADRFTLVVKRGKMVAELIMPGIDKGEAVGKFIASPAFKQACPLFVGDDITDEDAFAKVLQYDGGGILVGPQRETFARWRLSGVADVLAWLKEGLA